MLFSYAWVSRFIEGLGKGSFDTSAKILKEKCALIKKKKKKNVSNEESLTFLVIRAQQLRLF